GNMHGLDGKAERRVLRLINPAYQGHKNRRQRTTTHTMLMTMQLLKPGEVAQDHRHKLAAFRFILKGSGAFMIVEGEKNSHGGGRLDSHSFDDVARTPKRRRTGDLARRARQPLVVLASSDHLGSLSQRLAAEQK